MTIESNNAQILVEDSEKQAGVNVNRTARGFGADLSFWGGENYLRSARTTRSCTSLSFRTHAGYKTSKTKVGTLLVGFPT